MPPPSSPSSGNFNGGRASFHMSRQPESFSPHQPSPLYEFPSLFADEAELGNCAPQDSIHDDILERKTSSCVRNFSTRIASTDVNQDLDYITSVSSSSTDLDLVDDNMEPGSFHCKRWSHGSWSPYSGSSISCEGCLHVPSAASECSAPEENDDCVDYIKSPLAKHGLHDWCVERKVEAEFLAPSHSVFARRRKRKDEFMEIDRVVHKLQAENAEAGYLPMEERCDSRTCGCDGKKNEESMLKDKYNMPTPSGRFVYEALTKLQDTFCQSSNKAPLKDPTDNLQDRLENLLFAVQTSACEHKRLSNAPSELNLREHLDGCSGGGAGNDCISKDVRL